MSFLLAEAEALDLTEPLRHFAEHGYAKLGPILSAEGIQALTTRAEDLMMGRVVHPGMFFQMDASTGFYKDAPLGKGYEGPSLGYRKMEKLERDPLYLAWLRNPLFERICRAEMQGDVNLYRAILFNKGLHGGTEIPWHQDGGKLWGLSEEPRLQIWTALDDAPLEGGCLEVIPGTHREGLVSPLGGVVSEARVQESGMENYKVALPVRAGEGILLHNQVWHRSGRGRVGQRRLAFSACLLTHTTRCLRTRHPKRVFFTVFGQGP